MSDSYMQLLQPPDSRRTLVRLLSIIIACTSVTVTDVSSSLSLFVIFCGTLQRHLLTVAAKMYDLE